MKIVKFVVLFVLVVVAAVFVKWKFFNPFDAKVRITKRSRNKGTRKFKKLVLAGPFATASHPMIHMVKSGALNDIAEEVEFRLWKDPDQLRAMVLNKEVHFVALPTNVAANLYNKKVRLQLVNVSVWGILGMLTRDKNLKRLKDFKGKKVLVPFRADMPDLFLRFLLKAQGFDLDKDIQLSYVSNPINAMQMLVMGRARHALLAEPAISMALQKTASFPLKVVAPKLYRSADLQKEWASTFKTSARIPQAGIAALGKLDKTVLKRFQEEYTKALKWYIKNPKKAGKETAETLPMLDAKALANSIKYITLDSVVAGRCQKQLESFFRVLLKSEPKVVGGKLPDKGFYYR